MILGERSPTTPGVVPPGERARPPCAPTSSFPPSPAYGLTVCGARRPRSISRSALLAASPAAPSVSAARNESTRTTSVRSPISPVGGIASPCTCACAGLSAVSVGANGRSSPSASRHWSRPRHAARSGCGATWSAMALPWVAHPVPGTLPIKARQSVGARSCV